MINKYYRKAALEKYGEACEICGHRTSLEVHHIDYQEHQAIEDELKKLQKLGTLTNDRLQFAKDNGYDLYDVATRQLSKNDDTKNTSVLCGNCHSLVHTMDVGKKLLKAIKERI
ncbi:hypothetical protein V7128_01660 [Neobacillus vireti]|uniref:hypothetical protein n=1 Tax=Neobacillus vireti TaxID=220686 RepID=UPI002FFF223A